MDWEAVLERPTNSPQYVFLHVSYLNCGRFPTAARTLGYLSMRYGEDDTRDNLEHDDRRIVPFCCHLQRVTHTIAYVHYTDPRSGGDSLEYAWSYNWLTRNYGGHL